LIAGNLALDFVNTLDDRYTTPKELLTSYGDLLRFCEDTASLPLDRVLKLIERSYMAQGEGQRILEQARQLREAIHDVFFAFMHKKPAPPAALARLNGYIQGAAEHMLLIPAQGYFEWSFDDFVGFAAPLWPIARAAADLLASDQLEYVRACSSKTCEWMFLDTSKNHHRRWCDMTRCGNRAKVRRFYDRQKKR
jgi:predicted RNA-binding Zn ribbon-like protein